MTGVQILLGVLGGSAAGAALNVLRRRLVRRFGAAPDPTRPT